MKHSIQFVQKGLLQIVSVGLIEAATGGRSKAAAVVVQKDSQTQSVLMDGFGPDLIRVETYYQGSLTVSLLEVACELDQASKLRGSNMTG